MDFVCLSCVITWAVYHRTTRLAWSLSLFYLARSQNQKYFYLGRYPGYMYDYPGVPSVTIAYFDTNDFYFSGHVGSCMIYTCELMALGHPKLSLIGLTILINQWIYLTFTRSHFVIDMMTGVAVGITAHRGGEFVSYLADVLIFRFRKERRQPYWYKPCGRCGWNVANASLLVNKAEEEY